MSGTLYSCIAKSYDGGQRFYEFRQMEYMHLQDKLAFEHDAIKLKNIPYGGAMTDVWASQAVDSCEASAYIRSLGKPTHYNGLKPLWMLINLRTHNILSNFTISNDLMLEEVIVLRGRPNDECAMLLERSFGGQNVDFNMYPVSRNVTSGVVSNWSWWKSIQFIMKIWLLSQVEEAVVVYQILLEYKDADRPDRPTHFTYAIRFVAKDNALKNFLTTCFQNIVNLSHEQPADFQQFYAYSLERQYLSKTLRKLNRLAWERLQLEDKEKDGVVMRSSGLMDGSKSSAKEQIRQKTHSILQVAGEVERKAAINISKLIRSQKPKPSKQDTESDESESGDKTDSDSVSSVKSTRSVSEAPEDIQKNLIITGAEFDRNKPLKAQIEEFFSGTLGLDTKIVNGIWLGNDKNGFSIVCVLFQTIADRNEVKNKNGMLRRLGSRVYFNDYKTKNEQSEEKKRSKHRSKSQPRPSRSTMSVVPSVVFNKSKR